jgi:HTH-type transcriptional regulator/antitoxin HigA
LVLALRPLNHVESAEIRIRPHTEAEYQRLVTLLDRLVDEVGENESHPLASLMEIVGVLIEKYEDEHVPELPMIVAS